MKRTFFALYQGAIIVPPRFTPHWLRLLMESIESPKNREQKLLKSLGEQIRRLRLAHNVSQEALAIGSGIGLSTLKRLESGRGCNLSVLVQLLVALGYEDRLERFFAQLAEEASGGRVPGRRRASSPRKT